MPAKPSGQTPSNPEPKEQSPWALAGLGAQFFVALILFVYAGNWMDARFRSSPLFLLVGVFVGGGGTFYVSYRQLMRRMNDADARRKANSDKESRS